MCWLHVRHTMTHRKPFVNKWQLGFVLSTSRYTSSMVRSVVKNKISNVQDVQFSIDERMLDLAKWRSCRIPVTLLLLRVKKLAVNWPLSWVSECQLIHYKQFGFVLKVWVLLERATCCLGLGSLYMSAFPGQRPNTKVESRPRICCGFWLVQHF